MATKGMTYSTNRKTVQSELKSTGKNASAKNVTAEIERRQLVNRARAIKSRAIAQAKQLLKEEAIAKATEQLSQAVWNNPEFIENVMNSPKSMKTYANEVLKENAINTKNIKKDVLKEINETANNLFLIVYYKEYSVLFDYFPYYPYEPKIDSSDPAFASFMIDVYPNGRTHAQAQEILMSLIQRGLDTTLFVEAVMNGKGQRKAEAAYKEFMASMKDKMSQ